MDGVAVNTTSKGVGVDNAGRLSLHFIVGATAGTATFTAEVSNDGVNYVAYRRLIDNLTNTNAQMDTRVASVVINATGSSMVFIPAGDTFNFIRTKLTVAGTLSGTVIAYVN